MANDRIFIRCPKCKKARLLYKYYPSGGYAVDIGPQFMEQHIRSCLEVFNMDLGGDPRFELLTESGMSPEDWDIIMGQENAQT